MAYKRTHKNLLSTKCSLKFANTGKREELTRFIDEYSRVCQLLVDALWDVEKIPGLLGKEFTNPVKDQTWLSARAIQCCGKQASGIVRGTRKKQEQRLYRLNELVAAGQFRQARKLQRIIDQTRMSRPVLKRVCPELDDRFVERIDGDNDTSFDVWVTIGSLGRGVKKIVLPARRTKHFNGLAETGNLIGSIRLSTGHVTFMFDMPTAPEVACGSTVGLDVGVNALYACSDGQFAPTDVHGWTMQKIADRIARRRCGSKGFARAAAHRESFINWSVKQLNLDGVKTVRMENLKGLKQRPVSRVVRGWLYPALQEGVEEVCRRRGVRVDKVGPTFTSQRCSQCGWTRRANRRGESFRCTSCGFATHADRNAALNLSLDLEPLSGRERREKMNVGGFHWYESSRGQERMVPDV